MYQVKKKNIVLSLLLFSTLAHSQCYNYETNGNESEGGASCNEYNSADKPIAEEVRSMVDSASDYNTVDDFLAALPESLRSNFILMGESRSFQTGTKENPRVILSSPASDVRLSFNNDHHGRGGNSLEMSVWNPTEQRFDYMEVEYPEGKPPKVRKNPPSCTMCHGNPAKPNWDNYNYWSGMMPFNKDTIAKGTKESQWVLDFYKKVEKAQNEKKGRLKNLKLFDSVANIEKNLEKNECLAIPIKTSQGYEYGSAGGLGVNTFDRLQERQACTFQKDAERKTEFKAAKYILNMLADGCSVIQLAKAMPEWLKNRTSQYFQSQQLKFSQKENISFRDVMKDTKEMQTNIGYDKRGRQLQFMEQVLGSKEEAKKELEKNIKTMGINIPGISPGKDKDGMFRGESPKEVAKFRYFLEPLGFDISRISTAVDPLYYSFSDTFEPSRYLSDEVRDSISKELSEKGLSGCAGMAKLAKKNLVEPDIKKSVIERTTLMCIEADFASTNKEIERLVNFDEDLLELRAKEILSEKCVNCHRPINSEVKYSRSGPVIPFDNIQKLTEKITETAGSTFDLGEKIIDRISRNPHLTNSMPLEGITELKPEDKAYIIQYIKAFQKKAKDE